MERVEVVYNDRIARQFALASIVWGVAGMSVGLLLGLQLLVWEANLPPYLSFGRLRPLHTHAVVFAFVGNMVFAGIYYSSQRLLKARLPSDRLGAIHFWGWQLIIVAAALTLPLGYTQGKEYAELEWPIDVAVAIVWIVFAVNFFWMVRRRNEEHLYVSIWFYIATILAVTGLHLVNGLAVPVGALKSYSLFAGSRDALVQWWYGSTAVEFFLAAPVLGIMYYFVPRAAERPVYSYRLSILHFWAFTFLYAWVGPRHLLNTALPDWAQTLGVAFSLMLWGASWGGVLNGLLTLRGLGSRLRRDPVLKFFTGALVFLALSSVEGPLLGLKTVSSLAHYTDWVIGHVHAGGLGWNGFMAAAVFYWLVPRLYGARLHSRPAAHAHFYLATVGILLYLSSMWIAGATQGLMWRAQNPDGSLTYTFVQTLAALDVAYWGRLTGGTLYLAGFLLMGWNLYRTIRAGGAADGEAEVEVTRDPVPPLRELLFSPPVAVAAAVLALLIVAGLVNPLAALAFLVFAFSVALGGIAAATLRGRRPPGWHRRLESRGLALTLLALLAVSIGGLAEYLPLGAGPAEPAVESEPYTPLQLEGRDVYLEEGCHACHSQMIRPFLWEVARYGEISSASDSVYDHPFQWGSRRVGPDLARVGGRYTNLWHYRHMIDPRAVTPRSNMPPYPHLAEATIDLDRTASKMSALRAAGVPYGASEIRAAREAALEEARTITRDVREAGGAALAPKSKLVALIAYLQRLGRARSHEE